MTAAKTSKSFVIGITGTIGSGKSLVGNILQEKNIPVIDTDQIVHKLLTSETEVRSAVIERFSASIADGTTSDAIDRKKLGALVFKDEHARKDLESIVHPAVRLECESEIERLKGNPIIAVLVPLLFEAGLQDKYDEVWTVIASEPVILQRLELRDHLDDAEIKRRLKAQWSQERKCSSSDRIIDNSGTVEQTRKQVECALSELIGR